VAAVVAGWVKEDSDRPISDQTFEVFLGDLRSLGRAPEVAGKEAEAVALSGSGEPSALPDSFCDELFQARRVLLRTVQGSRDTKVHAAVSEIDRLVTNLHIRQWRDRARAVLLVEARGQQLALSLRHVQEVRDMKTAGSQSDGNGSSVVNTDSPRQSLWRLWCGEDAASTGTSEGYAVMVCAGGSRVALLVDRVRGVEECEIRRPGRLLSGNPALMGMAETTMGIIPLLDLSGFLTEGQAQGAPSTTSKRWTVGKR
jgi:hypothetical protein